MAQIDRRNGASELVLLEYVAQISYIQGQSRGRAVSFDHLDRQLATFDWSGEAPSASVADRRTLATAVHAEVTALSDERLNRFVSRC